MGTPKTDIEQSIGRILRDKHSNPLVIDIIDSHRIFKNQWAKRKTFYKKENYTIVQNDNIGYLENSSGWETIYFPGEKKCKAMLNNDDDENIDKGQCLLNFKKAKSESIC